MPREDLADGLLQQMAPRHRVEEYMNHGETRAGEKTSPRPQRLDGNRTAQPQQLQGHMDKRTISALESKIGTYL